MVDDSSRGRSSPTACLSLPLVGDDATVTAGPRTYRHGEFDPADLAAAKRGRSVSVCIPARDEQANAGTLSRQLHLHCAERGKPGPGLLRRRWCGGGGRRPSIDVATTAAAAAWWCRRLRPCAESKGEAAWRGRRWRSPGATWSSSSTPTSPISAPTSTTGAPRRRRGPGPAKGRVLHERPLHGRPGEGGRVTELVARPVIDLLFPHLADVAQPLAGETAAPRAVLEIPSWHPAG